MQCSHETKRTFYSRKPPFFELNDLFTPRKLPAIRFVLRNSIIIVHTNIIIPHFQTLKTYSLKYQEFLILDMTYRYKSLSLKSRSHLLENSNIVDSFCRRYLNTTEQIKCFILSLRHKQCLKYNFCYSLPSHLILFGGSTEM